VPDTAPDRGVFDLAARRTLLQPLAGRTVAYAFTPSGAIAWEAPTGLTLEWTNAGQPKSGC
jgi:hypothetical protein